MSTARKAQMLSLPRSLRHGIPEDALVDAKTLVRFLDDVMSAFAVYESELGKETYKGVCLVLDLLTDKLDIGSESYKFPMGSWSDDAPALAEREE